MKPTTIQILRKAGSRISLALFLLVIFGGDLTANTAYSVALNKLEGKSDTEVFQDSVMQNALGLEMQVGTRAGTAFVA